MTNNADIRELQRIMGKIPIDQLTSLPYFKNRGCHFVTRGFIADNTGDNERIFSDVIKSHFERDNFSVLDNHSEDSLSAYFTTFQWLTTNVGKTVLKEALKQTGFKIVSISEKDNDQ
tara:strand:- start:61 stop:411 length:351 start_codon:yes stop_codon:yes gene_type:complete